MKLSQIRIFLAVIENGYSISRTVEKIFIVQSALSRQIKLFEDELGHPLFCRLGKRFTGLTPFGEKVHKLALNMASNEKNLLALSKNWSEKESILTIATTHTQAKYFLPEAINKIRQKLPNLELRIEQSNPNNLITMLEKQQADVAICTEQIGDREYLSYTPCYQWQHGVVVSPNHPLSKYNEVTLAQVADYPIITYVYGFTGRPAIQRAFLEINRKPQIVLSASDSDVIKTYARIGFGVGIIAQMGYQKEDKETLKYLTIDTPIEPSQTGIAWLNNRYFNDTVKQAIEIIIQHGNHFDVKNSRGKN
jgi:DNA-binding transcriptional LysR family regulator